MELPVTLALLYILSLAGGRPHPSLVDYYWAMVVFPESGQLSLTRDLS